LVITLITDFGTAGPYVGSMKGVILSIHPDARIVDIAHDIRPQDVDEAAFVLNRAYAYFPAGTIHVVVVDPGVGSDRAVLAVRTERYIFLAPDNGVLKYVFDACPDARVFRVTNQDFSLSPVSRTFHGRDVFAPAAAHLSRGVDIERMGEPFTEYVRGEVQRPEVRPREIRGEIVFIDGFGNGITNIEEALFAGREVDSISVRSHVIRGLS
jgi:S-adenosylmethionine hydrolase